MTIFEEISERQIKCEICGSDTASVYGAGFDNDRIMCLDRDCCAEYVFPTTTLVDEE